MKLVVGDKVKICSEKQRYTVRAVGSEFAILTKPFNARKTFLYTVVDSMEGVRGHFGKWGPPEELDTRDGAEKTLIELESGRLQLTFRNVIDLTDSEMEQINAN